MRIFWTLVLTAGLTVSVAAQTESDAGKKPDKPDPQATYRRLVAEYSQARGAYFARLRKAKTKAEKQTMWRQYPRPEATAAQLLALAKANPEHGVAIKALSWIARQRVKQPGMLREVFEILRRDHLDAPQLAGVCRTLEYDYSPHSKALLRAAMQSKNRAVQAHACFALAGRSTSPARAGEYSIERAEALYEKVIKDHADAGQLVKMARSALYELRNLTPGKKAPEVTGTDFDGAPLKLSSFLGKVVVFYFWGDW